MPVEVNWLKRVQLCLGPHGEPPVKLCIQHITAKEHCYGNSVKTIYPNSFCFFPGKSLYYSLIKIREEDVQHAQKCEII